MKTKIIPAQITTVEDKIAGNLNLTQMLLLLAPILMGTFIYIVFPPTMSFISYKLPLSIIIFIICGVLAIRIRDRVVMNWVILLLVYFLRPHIFIYNKNNLFMRDTALNDINKEKAHTKKSKNVKENKNIDVITRDLFAANRDRSINIRMGKKGLIAVKV